LVNNRCIFRVFSYRKIHIILVSTNELEDACWGLNLSSDWVADWSTNPHELIVRMLTSRWEYINVITISTILNTKLYTEPSIRGTYQNIRTINSWGFVLQSATQSEARFKPQHASSNSLVDTSIICIFLSMESNKSGLTTIGVTGQGISASSCDNKNIVGKIHIILVSTNELEDACWDLNLSSDWVADWSTNPHELIVLFLADHATYMAIIYSYCLWLTT
jgi:hypothetical protein